VCLRTKFPIAISAIKQQDETGFLAVEWHVDVELIVADGVFLQDALRAAQATATSRSNRRSKKARFPAREFLGPQGQSQQPADTTWKVMRRNWRCPRARSLSATSRSAEMLDMKGEIGVIAPGAFAEVIAVAGDPLKRVEKLEHVKFVMHYGSIFKNEMAN
jgi:hypothetical protein